MIKYEKLLRQSKPYMTVAADKSNGLLGHCYMLVCDDETSCSNLCTLLARLILCEDGGCGVCRSCLRVDNDSHTELIRLNQYNAESVREFIEQAYYSVGEGRYKVMLADAFDKIEPRLQNTLLKTLEEPCEGVVFILGTTRPAAVLDTVKSRSKKLYLEKFDDDALIDTLVEEGRDEDAARNAVSCAFGSLGRAEKIVGNAEFMQALTVMVGILDDMKTSKDVINMLSRMRLGETKLSIYLDAMEIILKAMLAKRNGLTSGFDEIDTLSNNYNNAIIANIYDLLVECRKKLESNCRQDIVADRLLMGILEVKYLCR
ncbi:MAG: hypothetical protein ACI4MI_05490 [Christensenellales bacterium]